jgi:hypothetical protein
MQKKKNIRLLIILSGMIIVTVATYFLLQRDKSFKVSDPGLFAMDDVSQIDSVAFIENNRVKTLHYKNNDWLINDEYIADSRRLTVLFAVLNQVRAKRPVARAEQERIDSLLSSSGTKVQFFENEELVKEFTVAGLETKGVTYFRNDEETYVVNIPGYRSYLAAIFQMSISDWRDKLIFDEVSWNNLEKVEVNFPSDERNGFSISAANNYFGVEGIAATDSLKLLNYIDGVSLLMADEYLERTEVPDSLKEEDPLIVIAVTDIRNRPFRLAVYPAASEGYSHFALKDSTDWLRLSSQKVEPLIKGQRYFLKSK